MGGLKRPGRTLKSKPRRKALKCTVELTLHAITCPTVVFPSHNGVYVSVQMMGQYNKTKCFSPAFPLLLHGNMVFTKMFSEAFDPCDVADQLQNDTTCLELIQLGPPEGEILATFQENTRDFLYPGLSLIPLPRGSDREVLMRKSASFPGISPKVEFSTMSVIEECDIKISQPAVSPQKSLTAKTSKVRPRNSKPTASELCGYQRPTVASQSRCLSPYTHRRMCQLTDDAKQRLRHLQLGPYTFKKDTSPKPPFVVPCSPNSSLIESPTTSALQSSTNRSSSHQTSIRGHSQSVCPISPGEKSTSFLSSPSPRKKHAYQSTPVSSSLGDQSPLLSRSTLRERFHSPTSRSKEIHRRVQKLLHTLATPRRLTFEEKSEEGEPGQDEAGPSCHDSVHYSQLQEDRVIPGAPSVHLDNRTVWTNKAAKYTRKSHRAVFEDSLGKCYRNLYRKASSSAHSDSEGNWM